MQVLHHDDMSENFLIRVKQTSWPPLVMVVTPLLYSPCEPHNWQRLRLSSHVAINFTRLAAARYADHANQTRAQQPESGNNRTRTGHIPSAVLTIVHH